jgi:hypothetical protein
MTDYRVTFPNQLTLDVPPETAAAIAAAKAKYAAPLWHYREERVLKLGGHQWITPAGVVAARALLAQHPAGIVGVAWKLFNRGWHAGAEACFVDTLRLPEHPRHLGRNVLPLVDEDGGSQQVGWVRINQYTPMDDNFAVFVEFTILDIFAPQPPAAGYA